MTVDERRDVMDQLPGRLSTAGLDPIVPAIAPQ